MIGVVGKGKLPMVDILRWRRNARRLLIKENCERDFRSPQEAPLMR
jgi:hypothetical protein